MPLGQLDRLSDHPQTSARRRSQNHLSTEEAHQFAPLHAEGLCHRHHQRVSLLRAHHSKADSRIAAGRLDYGLTRLEATVLFCILDHAKGETVFHRAERVEGLDFYVEVYIRRRQFIDSDNGSVSDCLEDVGKSMSHSLFLRRNDRSLPKITRFLLDEGAVMIPHCEQKIPPPGPGRHPLDGVGMAWPHRLEK